MEAEQILKALRCMDRPDMAYGYDGAYRFKTEKIGTDASDLIESQQFRIAELEKQLSESQRREQAAVEDIADFIAEYADCLKIAIDTQDRHYLEVLIRQWRGPQEAGKGEAHDQ